MIWSTPERKPVVRLWIYCPWAGRPGPAEEYLADLANVNLSHRLGHASDPRLLRMARLDCDWQGENVRCFAALRHPGLEFRPAQVLGASGLAEFVNGFAHHPAGENWWLVFTGQQPGELPPGVAAKVAAFTRRNGGRVLF
jgi:hypothetical protein